MKSDLSRLRDICPNAHEEENVGDSGRTILISRARMLLLGCLMLASPASSWTQGSGQVAVAPQYGTTHVYTDEQHIDALVRSFLATFGGHASDRLSLTVTPTPSVTYSQLVFTPVGMLSVFAFKTPVPAPFGGERTGYLVTDIHQAVKEAKASGAEVLIQPFKDPVGMDVVVRWDGGLETQLYWHTQAPKYAPFQTIPENRLYVSSERADSIARDYVKFSHGKVVEDERDADGAEIGQSGSKFRKLTIDSAFGRLTLLVTDGHLVYPFGHEITGYEVADVDGTVARATAAGATISVAPVNSRTRRFALITFPGGYVAEVHTTLKTSQRAGN